MSFFKFFKKRDYNISEFSKKKMTDISQYTAFFSKVADDISYYTYYTMQQGERLDTISQKVYGTPEYYWTIPYMNVGMINIFRDLPKTNESFINYLRKKYPGKALLLKQSEPSLASRFIIGENVATEEGATAQVKQIMPTLGYMQVAHDPETPPFPMTTTEYSIIGEDSGHIAIMRGTVEAYDAPYYYKDDNGNFVTYKVGAGEIVTIRDNEINHNDSIAQVKLIRPSMIVDVVKSFEREMKKQ